MKKTLITFLLTGTTLFNATAVSVTDAEIAEINQAVRWNRGSVHDPSITYTNVNGKKTYYVHGSHIDIAKTTDFKNWTLVNSERTDSKLFCDVNGNICSYDKAYTTNKVTSAKNYEGKMVNWGNFNISAYQGAINNMTVRGNQWAPDIIYNPVMKKWCYYMSLNGEKWNSAIVLFTSNNIEGPFQYQASIIFSGFNVTDNAATDWTKTDMKMAFNATSLPDRYKVGGKWGDNWPHAIDPGVFYDEKGELWMNYGSWSGGIYVIKLDKNTGLRDYTYKYNSDYDSKKAAVTTDAYFGKKIAGGCYVSGEGSYIEKIGKYYYLFMSYGFYSPEGGYEMRVFRSENPDGPYTDHTGESAIYTRYLMNYGTKAGTNRGMKLMGGYQWEGMSVAEIAQGHNSALMDEDGNAMVIYHTKLNNGTIAHQLRVHQLFVNQDGWITAAPHEYNRDNDVATTSTVGQKAHFSKAEIEGSYNFILHKYNVDYANYEYTKPVKITLNADGTVSGNYSGKWSTTEGTSYITLTLNNVTYKGVVVPGSLDATNTPVVAITAMSTSNGVNICASKLSGKACIAKDVAAMQSLQFRDGDAIYGDIDFANQTTANGCTVKWTSSNTNIIDNNGNVTTPATDTPVKLTAALQKGDYEYTKTIEVNVKAEGLANADIATGIVAYYNFDNNLVNQYNEAQVGTANAQASGTKPSFDKDATHGTVLHQYFGYDDAKSISYTTFANPLAGQQLTGATVSAWVQRLDGDQWDALWAFCDGSFGNIGQRYYLTGNTYIGYNDGNGTWFDYNHPDAATSNTIPVKEWALVTISYNNKGFDLYINGKFVANQSRYIAYNASGTIDYSQTLNHLSKSTNFYLGYGSFWGSAPALFDDLVIWNRALSAADVARLYKAETNGESLLPNEIANADTAKLIKHGAGKSEQTIKVDSALVEFYYNWENATNVEVSGLPNGITATIDKATKKVTFSGVANDVPGEYKYTITTIGAKENITIERVITIEAGNLTNDALVEGDAKAYLYPNPTDGTFFIKSADGASTINIYNTMGQLVFQQHCNHETVIEANLTKGCYIVEIKSANNIKQERLIVK